MVQLVTKKPVYKSAAYSGCKTVKHVVSMKDLSNEEIMAIIDRAAYFKANGIDKTQIGCTVSNLFFEPSTRTSMSFEMAERKLGIDVLPFDPGSSSVLKGETLYDTVRTLEAIGVDALIVRHPQDGYYNDLIGKTNVSIINGGDGSGQHPTQSLLDLFTIKEEFGAFEGLNILIAGDISHSRVARSNADALKKLGANVTFLCPPEWSGEFESVSDWDDVIESSDVVMLLRVQHERHDEEASFTKEEYLRQYGLTEEREKRMKDHAIVMHPAPVNRDVEIASSLVECERSRIFKQMENGVYIRAAILDIILGGR